MKLTRSALVAAAAAALLVAVPATAASAQTVLHLDPTHDVRSLDFSTLGTFTPAPKVPQGDVQAIAIRHAQHNVTVTVKYRELTKGNAPATHQFFFRTNTGKRWAVGISAGPGSWDGTQRMEKMSAGMLGGDPTHCAGMHHALDYVKNKATLTVPRSCLGRPRWVEVGEQTTWFHVAKSAPGSTDPIGDLSMYIDDAFSSFVSGNMHWSRRVHRG